MTGIDTSIERALLTRLTTLDFTQSQIAWPNMPFQPTNGTAWLRPSFLPAQTEAGAASAIAHNRYAGLFQVSLFYPAGSGTTAPSEEADGIMTHFKRDTKLTEGTVTVLIIGPPYRLPAELEPDWLHIPIRIPYRCQAANP